jgi:hypothetical protein
MWHFFKINNIAQIAKMFANLLNWPLVTEDKSAFEDTGDGEGDEEPEEDEHDVVHGEGGRDTEARSRQIYIHQDLWGRFDKYLFDLPNI